MAKQLLFGEGGGVDIAFAYPDIHEHKQVAKSAWWNISVAKRPRLVLVESVRFGSTDYDVRSWGRSYLYDGVADLYYGSYIVAQNSINTNHIRNSTASYANVFEVTDTQIRFKCPSDNIANFVEIRAWY